MKSKTEPQTELLQPSGGEKLSFVESFSQWLDLTNDALPEPKSFSEWLHNNNDTTTQPA